MRSNSSVRLRGAARGRAVAGILGLAVSLGYGQQAWSTLPLGKMSQPGAAVFPLFVAALMAVSSLLIVLEEVRGAGDPSEPLGFPRGADLQRLLAVLAALVAYVIVASLAGHLIASTLMSLALVHLIKPGSWVRTIVAGLAISLSAYALFVMILAVPLPEGSLG